MAHIRSTRGGRAWFGKREAKAAGRVSRRQADDEAVEEEQPDEGGLRYAWDGGW